MILCRYFFGILYGSIGVTLTSPFSITQGLVQKPWSFTPPFGSKPPHLCAILSVIEDPFVIESAATHRPPSLVHSNNMDIHRDAQAKKSGMVLWRSRLLILLNVIINPWYCSVAGTISCCLTIYQYMPH